MGLLRGITTAAMTAALLALGASAASANAPGGAGAVITHENVQLGVNSWGNLNFAPPDDTSPDERVPSQGGNSTVGLRFLRGEEPPLEATADGCTCEGWGIADAGSGLSGSANDDSGYRGLELVDFSFDETSATSIMRTNGSISGGGTVDRAVVEGDPLPVIEVRQAYAPAPGSDAMYQDRVTVTNVGDVPVTDLRYRRVMDWDVEPTAFSEFSTIDGTDTANLLFSSDDGFDTADPLGARGFSSYPQCTGGGDDDCTGFFTDAGPGDHGAHFDFGFGSLAPGESKTFFVYYGAAPDEAGALDAVAAVGAEVWSFGQSSVENGPTLGVPATFIFAFSTTGAIGGGSGPAPSLTLDAPAVVGVGADGSTKSFDVRATLRNFGGAPATGLVAGLTAPSGLTVSGGGTAALGDLAPGMVANAVFTVDPDDACADRTLRIGGTAQWNEAVRTPGLTASKTIIIHGTCGRVFGVLAGTDRSGHGGIANAQVDLCPATGDCSTPVDSTQTNTAGRYEFGELPEADYRVIAHGAGAFADPASQTTTVFHVGPGADVRRDFTWENLDRVDPDTEIGGAGLVGLTDGFPTLYWEAETLIRHAGCPVGTAVADATFRIIGPAPDNEVFFSGPMRLETDGDFSITVPRLFPHHGEAHAEFAITCDAAVTTPGFDLYIDPSGNVVDTLGRPVVGATVTLLRFEGATLGYVAPPSGSAVMSPANRVNPDTTDGAGHFGWDVTAGFYVVEARKAGCHAPGDPSAPVVQTPTMTIPPPVTDIVLTLDCGEGATSGGQTPSPGTSSDTPQGPTQPSAAASALATDAGPGGGAGSGAGPGTPKLTVGLAGRGVRTQRGRRVVLVRSSLTLNRGGGVRLRIVDAKGHALALLPGSKLGAVAQLRRASSIVAALPAGPTGATLRVPRSALKAGSRYRLVVTGSTGGRGTQMGSFSFRG